MNYKTKLTHRVSFQARINFLVNKRLHPHLLWLSQGDFNQNRREKFILNVNHLLRGI